MAEPVDYYDVQAMIRDARSEIRGEIDNAVREAAKALRDELDGLAIELREELRSVARTLDARTGRLA